MPFGSKMGSHHKTLMKKHKMGDKSLFLFGVASLLWFIFRTGTKPTRIVYPCQRAALANSSMLLSLSIPLSLTMISTRTKRLFPAKTMTLALIIVLASATLSGQFLQGFQPAVLAVKPNQELHLTLEPKNATLFPASDVFAVHGRAYAHVSDLIYLMGSQGLLFYKSDTSGTNRGPDGLIANDDVVLIKINEEWPYRGGTNTDVLKELIQAIVDHPDGFAGEIVVADNGQWQGNMNWPQSNAQDITQSTQDVVNMFSGTFNVSTYSWRAMRNIRVNEYSAGDIRDGYVATNTPDPETGFRPSYPKFKTTFGTYVSFKQGIWNGTGYEEQLKIVNVPVLKSHSWYGVTASLKHYMGVQSEETSNGFSNGHYTVGTGGMGTLMVETGLPTLNIIDAIWVNANPMTSSMSGPSTPYSWATRVNTLMASVDPVAVDYWAAKHVLVQASRLIGYTDTSTLDPDNTSAGQFGRWLNLTKNEIARSGYNVTNDENRMNVYVYPQPVHDVAVVEMAVSKTVIGEGYPLNINVTVQNQGDYDENFNLTIYANTTIIYKENLTLSSAFGRLISTTFAWNTTGVTRGNHNLTATITIVSNETDSGNNVLAYGIVKVTIPGDITGDFFVNIEDATQHGLYWQQFVPPAPANVDISDDGFINIKDATIIGINWLKTA